MKHTWTATIIILLTAMLFVGCNSQTTPPPVSVSPTSESTPEIAPTQDFTQPGAVILSIPTPTSETGVVTGVILLAGNPPLPAKAIVALGDILLGSTGDRLLASYDRLTDPYMLVDANGRFFFADILPGEYALIYDRIADSLLLRDPATGEDLIITVEAGQTVDLGEMIFSDLPGANP